MGRFTTRRSGARLIAVPRDWFTFQDVLKWYFLDQIQKVGDQQTLAEKLDIQRTQIGETLSGKKNRAFSFEQLEAIADKLDTRRKDILDELHTIAWDMTRGDKTQEQLAQRIKDSQKRGRKPGGTKPLQGPQWAESPTKQQAPAVQQRTSRRKTPGPR